MKGKKRHGENVIKPRMEEITEKGKYTALNLFSVTKIVVVVVVVFDLQMEEEKLTLLNHLSTEKMCGGFWQTSETHLEPGGVFDYGHALHHFKVEINTHTHTQTTLTRRQDLVTATSYLPTLNAVPHGYTHRTHSSEIWGPF